MEFSYEENEQRLKQYTENCRERIENTFFSEEQLKKSTAIKSGMVAEGKIDASTSISEAIIIHRKEMIDIKLNHTMRVVSDVSKMAEKLNVNIDFEKVLKVAALLHDIARFDQATWSDSFNDRDCPQFQGMYHAEFGYHLLYIDKRFTEFDIPQKYQFAISQAVRYHQIPKVTGDLALTFQDPKQLDVDYLTGREDLNEQEKVIIAALVQMVKDVDMLDILYQHLTGEFPVIRNSITYDVCGETLDDISKHFEIDKAEIMTFNGLESEDLSGKKSISVPVAHVNPVKLQVPIDIQTRFFNNEELDLKELQNRQDWTFITGMWWRLNHFLNNINFVSNLEVVLESQLLDKIFALYPDQYKPLVEPAFAYAKEYLLEKVIEKNSGKIYRIR